ncbi:MAG: alpha/beta hydrolase [Pirellulales bacterium]
MMCAQTSESGIEYADPEDQHLVLDLAAPEGDGPFPAVVCIHGGGFREGDRTYFNATCEKLAQHGYVAVTIEYRLAPKYPFPAAVEDCKAAVRWLRANAEKYHIDPKRIGATGASAGGTLALFLGTTGDEKKYEGDGGNADESSRVQCVVSHFGAADFTKSYGKSVDAADVLPLYLGGNLEEARAKHVEASPLTWVTKDDAPTLCLHGVNDKYVAVEQSEFIVGKLKKAGVEAKLVKYDGAGHGFEGDVYEKADEEMIRFFDAHLKKGSARARGEGVNAVVRGILWLWRRGGNGE